MINEYFARQIFPRSSLCNALVFHFKTSVCLPAAAIMSSVLQKLISPLASGPAEPPRNKVTVVGVGQVGMACAISILLRVRLSNTVCYRREMEKSKFTVHHSPIYLKIMFL